MKNCEESAETEKTTGQERDKSIASEESDDDILPPAIFYKPKRFSEICTPTKVSTPANNDLSPITPSEEIVQSKKKKRRRLCFKKLVKEKAAQDEIDRKLSKMNEELKEGLENGREKFVTQCVDTISIRHRKGIFLLVYELFMVRNCGGTVWLEYIGMRSRGRQDWRMVSK